VLNFVPDAAAATAAMRDAARHALVAAYVWDYAGRMELMRHFWDAAVALDSAVDELDEGVRFPISHPDRLGVARRRPSGAHGRCAARPRSPWG
jgi:hypothetical protein